MKLITEKHLEVGTLLTQILLAIVGVLYLIETHFLRKSSGNQLKVLEKQLSASVVPFFVLTADSEKEMLAGQRKRIERFLADYIGSTAEEKLVDYKRTHRHPLVFCTIKNATDRLGLNVATYLYDADVRNFRNCDKVIPIFQQNTTETLTFSRDPLDQASMLKKAIERFDGAIKLDDILLDHSPLSYVMVVYQDVNHGVHAIKRSFKMIDGEFHMAKTKYQKLD